MAALLNRQKPWLHGGGGKRACRSGAVGRWGERPVNGVLVHRVTQKQQCGVGNHQCGSTITSTTAVPKAVAHLPLGSLSFDTTPSGPAWCPGGRTAQNAFATCRKEQADRAGSCVRWGSRYAFVDTNLGAARQKRNQQQRAYSQKQRRCLPRKATCQHSPLPS